MRLQPLRIPTGWDVTWNTFYEADPIHFNEEDSNFCLNFTEDLLQMKRGNIILDLGWYPECKVDGEYRLVVIQDEEWEKPFFSFETRDKATIIHKIEELLLSTS